MIKKLQSIFPSLRTQAPENQDEKDCYKWFITPENEVIGIRQTELTEKDITLLAAFLTPYNVNLPRLTKKEQQWMQQINQDESAMTLHNIEAYRFVYFTFPANKLDPSAFRDAIHEIFTRQVPILWKDDHSGIMIEEQIEAISYDQIADVLMSDLYVKINFLVGPYLTHLTDAKKYYQTLISCAQAAIDFTEKVVLPYSDAIPHLFVDQVEAKMLTIIPEMILKETFDDHELLQTIEAFIACNLNISVTAKELYMHRNSLQYRLDKFIEKTGIDVRQFPQAMTVQLALLSKKHRD
ncbi:PucR family transcriptional regulator [Lentibacillus sp. Marseille-P4043]|uniref:PucR family transcriptional regulator n=1 Tax=Lentibacillus sp. Marseille-P4043 TaxID=2040293 RepID=UPI00131A59A3|nr:helix-turn-helix domain-containing protein [Lentibacillus sp. Marseille-P4043]